ncbi:hypothetical protein H4Q26_005222 [Puccinia striiformis f. sp. tritici PST-130]|nr:hypothetical protein H4Q26_005222 [Puccinia striiformis f. sp. tritici PST-130]
MSQTFTPTAKFSSNERDWQAEIAQEAAKIWYLCVLSEGENNLVQPSPAATAPSHPRNNQTFQHSFRPEKCENNLRCDELGTPPIAQQSSINPVEAPSAPTAEQTPAPAPEEEELPRVMMPDGSRFIPSRKVREPVGGHSSMADLLSGGR